MTPDELKRLNLSQQPIPEKFSKDMQFTGYLEMHEDKYVRVRPSENSNDYLSFEAVDVLTAVVTGDPEIHTICVKEGATVVKSVREFGTVDRTNIVEFIQGDQRSVIRVFSPRLNEYIDVPLTPSNVRDEQLAGMMPVMLVTDNPLAITDPSLEEGWEPVDVSLISEHEDVS